MAVLPNQENRPIIFVLFTSAGLNVSSLGFPPMLAVLGHPGIEHPESYTYHRPSRGAVYNTKGGAWLDDFGEGVGKISISGHTGWHGGDQGLVAFKNLEEMFIQYHRRRDQLATDPNNGDPESIRMWIFDTINLEISDVYPDSFVMVRDRNRPLLYQYQIQLTVLQDVLNDTIVPFLTDKVGNALGKIRDLIPDLVANQAAVSKAVLNVGLTIGSVVTTLVG